jgi:hypothetical protein
MNNYMSIGCDALVTLNFHSNRDSLPFSNRFFNKVISLYFFVYCKHDCCYSKYIFCFYYSLFISNMVQLTLF